MKTNRRTLVFALMLYVGMAAGQSPVTPGLRLPSDTARAASSLFALPSLELLSSSPYTAPPPVRQSILKAPKMPAAWSYGHLGAFCKWEVQLEKAARMPVKFRLGEVQYVERLEGKLPDY